MRRLLVGFGLACLTLAASAGGAAAGAPRGSIEYYEPRVVTALAAVCCVTVPFTLTVAVILVYRWVNPNDDGRPDR